MRNLRSAALGGMIALALAVGACGDSSSERDAGGANAGGGQAAELSGTIRIDGSSTVAPLSEPIAELFMERHPGVTVTVATSGTGGGFEKLCAGEIDIADASRPIKPDEEDACARGGVSHDELTVANDALTVVVNPDNPVTCMTVEQLKQVWGPRSAVQRWSQISGLDGAPDAELDLYGPGTDSGTFDYFTAAINGEEGAQRTDYNNVGEDDNATVTGVAGSVGGMGYFGYSFYLENRESLKALEIDSGSGCVAPSAETTQSGEYAPLGRQLYIYPSAEALRRPEVEAFVDFYIENVNRVAEQAGFIGLTDEQIVAARDKVARLAS